MSVVLAAGRALAESRMHDQCTIRRRIGEVTDPASGVITPTYSTLYSGKCQVQQLDAQGREETVGQAFVLMLVLQLKLPMTVIGLQVDDEVVINGSRYDEDLVGRTFYIRDLMHKSHATARRVSIQERTS